MSAERRMAIAHNELYDKVMRLLERVQELELQVDWQYKGGKKKTEKVFPWL